MRGARLDAGPGRPYARERAIGVARRDPPPDISAEAAVAEIQEVLTSIGDTCPERENGEA
jgi:hypothetical protein